MSEQKLEWSVELLKEYIEWGGKYLDPNGNKWSEDQYDNFAKLKLIFMGKDNRLILIDLYEKAQSRIKELEEENKRFREALEREECSCSSSTGELRTKGPDSICNRCEALSDINKL